MSKPLAIGLIFIFVAMITSGILWLAFRGAPKSAPESIPPISFPPGGEKPKEQKDTTDQTQPSERALTQILGNAASGFLPMTNGIIFSEKNTGNVFQTNQKGQDKKLISNTTIPAIFAVSWASDGKKALIHYREPDTNLVYVASTQFFEGKAKGVLLPPDVIDFDYSPDRPKIFYLIKEKENIVGIIAEPDNSKQVEVIQFPAMDFTPDWFTPREISFLSRPSGEANGFLYRYNLDTESFTKLLGNYLGLEIKWSKDGSKLIFSSFDVKTKKPSLFLYEVKQAKVAPLNIQTFAQKCAWQDNATIYCAIPTNIAQGIYPDMWHKGEVTFEDHVWKIDLKTLQKTLIKNLSKTDILTAEISPEKNYLYFQNKKDGSLWSLQLQ